jgi:glycosyltransferase involved in cell wall biosynthesis
MQPEPILVFVGRLVTTKGVRLLLEAARLLLQQRRVFQVLIVGDGPERTSLEALVREWQLTSNVRFLGRLLDSQVSETLASASAIIVPSLGGEVFGMVVGENMLRGLAVIASDLGSFAEVLGGTGLTFVTGDSVDLARQIAKVLDDRSYAQQLGAAARRRVLEIFGLSRMIDGHIAIYRRIAEKRDT